MRGQGGSWCLVELVLYNMCMEVYSEAQFYKVVENLAADDLRGDGLVIAWNKQSGMTSHDVVAKIRRYLVDYYKFESWKKMKIKVGHAGTLDPLACGLLLVLVGKATKRQSEFMKLDKTYIVKGMFGVVSDTYDIDGNLELSSVGLEIVSDLSREDVTQRVIESLDKFRGDIDQRVPAFSAIKRDGKKLYDLARCGLIQTNDLPVRQVKIERFELMSVELKEWEFKGQTLSVWEACFEVDCSSGTYVRSLINDLGKKMNVGAVVSYLERRRIGEYRLL